MADLMLFGRLYPEQDILAEKVVDAALVSHEGELEAYVPKRPYSSVKRKRPTTPATRANRKRYYREVTVFRKREPKVWLRLAFSKAKQRARENGLEFNITIDDIEFPDKCPALNVPFVFGKRHPHNPSLDRVHNELGYVKGNVIIVSCHANSLKGSLSVRQVVDIGAFYSRFLR